MGRLFATILPLSLSLEEIIKERKSWKRRGSEIRPSRGFAGKKGVVGLLKGRRMEEGRATLMSVALASSGLG